MFQLDLELVAGDSLSQSVKMTDAEGIATDLTGADISWYVAVRRVLVDAEVPLIEKLTADIEVDDPTSGIFTIVLDPADTVGLNGIYYHEAQVTEEDGKVSTVFSGIITIIPGLI